MDTRIARRRFLQSGGLLSVALAAGCVAVEPINGDDDGGPSETVVIGPLGEPRFEPDVLEITIGTEVEFEWGDSGFNLVVVSQPSDSDWEGEPEPQEVNHIHAHTFDIEGNYVVESTEMADEPMTATINVGEPAIAPPEDDPIGE